MFRRLLVGLGIFLANPAFAEELIQIGGDYYLVKPSECRTYQNLVPGFITCFDKKGRSTGAERALNPSEIEQFLAQKAQNQATYQALSNSLGQLNNQLQGTVNQGWVTLQQGQTAPSVGDYRYQNSSGVWIYCRRMSSWVVNCREL